MAKRYLGMAPREWDALPWHEQEMYREGYEWEGLIRSANTSPDAPLSSVDLTSPDADLSPFGGSRRPR